MKNDVELLERIARKDKSALSMLYDKYILMLYNLTRKYISLASEIESIITKLFKTIWNSPHLILNKKHTSKAIASLCLDLVEVNIHR